ncbi:hypothetical protein COV11_03910 [Candidatus Woesearchaeota archaeon CG10_big_fil_rev_8_21_14_0_10_30_7]|nr:MAG: hypothetical protein COV11_03910 [Candidatus Woesearchaeota archaeon CG10_big_fil_rev_8_21_14_0_10_30_7]
MTFIKVGRPGPFSVRKDEIINNYDKVYGKNNWRIIHHVNNTPISLTGVLALYEDAYFEHFKNNPLELESIAKNYKNVYDNNVSNVNSEFDYSIQEFGGNHYQDIAIRRVMLRFGLNFEGEELLEIRTKGLGKKWGPGELLFHMPKLIIKPELKGWWKSQSIESFYQSNKYLEVKDYDKDLRFKTEDITFVTSNSGKAKSATEALRNVARISSFKLDIKEELNSIEKIAIHKAKVAYSTLCRPVIVDDSGFEIPKLNNYPGHHVGRELKEKGLEHFLNLAKQHGPLESSWPMTVAYFDETLKKPLLFTSRVEGTLISESRGNPKSSNLKSQLGLAFIIKGQNKTLAEMTPEEYNKYARSDRWGKLAEYLKKKSKD